jgi:hypothetical protein
VINELGRKEKMELQDLELHDAVIDGMTVDYQAKTIAIRIRYYQDAVYSKQRTPARITFTGVSRLNEICDFSALTENEKAGNISYWHPAVGDGTTNIYLAEGLIVITAKTLDFNIEA